MTPPRIATSARRFTGAFSARPGIRCPRRCKPCTICMSERTADGVAVVERGSGLLARLVAFVIGLPPAGADIPVTVSFQARHGREHWQRNFAGRAFSSVQEQGRGRFERLLCERFGPLNFGMALVCESERMRLVIRRWSVCGIPLPRALAPRGDSTSSRRRGVSIFTWRSPTPSPG